MNQPTKLASYIWLYLGLWFISLILLNGLLNSLEFFLLGGFFLSFFLSWIAYFIAGWITSRQFYKRKQRLLELLELKHITSWVLFWTTGLQLVGNILILALIQLVVGTNLLTTWGPLAWVLLILLFIWLINAWFNWFLIRLSLRWGNKHVEKKYLP
jgi:hypothetical protein